MSEVTSLHYYPIKSCAETSAEELEVTETGFRHDREWMVVDADGKFMSQRGNPEMALIRPAVKRHVLRVAAPSMEPLIIPLQTDPQDVKEVAIHKKPALAEVVGASADNWFSEYLKKDVQLVRTNPNLPRFITDRYQQDDTTNRVGFADSFAFLLASEASLRDLNSNLDEQAPMNRFRPNIVVSGEGLEAYDEDYWRQVTIGSLQAFVVRACDRCPIPDTDQDSGLRSSRPVTAALKATRHGIDPTDPKLSQGNFFGQNLSHIFESGQTIRVGDEVTVIDRSVERNILT